MKALDELLALHRARDLRLRNQQIEVQDLEARAKDAQQRYSNLEADGSSAAPLALLKKKGADRQLAEARERLQALQEADPVTPRQKSLAERLLFEAASEAERLNEELDAAEAVLNEKQAEYLKALTVCESLQDSLLRIRKDLDRVFNFYPGGCIYGAEMFKKRPIIKIRKLRTLS